MTNVQETLADLHRFVEEGRHRAGVAGLASEWLRGRIARGEPGAVTPELLHAVDEIRYAREWREFGTPKALVDFIDKLANISPVRSVLDPTCGRGLLLQAIATSTQAEVVHGIDVNSECCAIAQAMLGDRGSIFHADALSSPAGLLPQYDLIAAHPPLGVRLTGPLELPGLGDREYGDLAQALAAWACSRLSERGRALLILAPSFLRASRGRSLVEAIHTLGCRIDALIHLPGGSLGNTGIPSYLAVFDRGVQRDVFIGEFADNSEHQEMLVDLYRRRKSGPRLSLGRLCPLERFCSFEALEAQERVSRLVKTSGWKPPELLRVLQRANTVRNETTGHGGAIGQEDAERIHDELKSLVDSVRSVFGRSWRDYELVQPAEGRYSSGVHHYQANRIMGTRSAPFETVQCESVQPLESGRLYLFDGVSQRGLLLQPFVQVMPSPQKKAMACFIFSRNEEGGAHFVSYHFEHESSLTQPFPEVAAALRRVHQFDEGAPS